MIKNTVNRVIDWLFDPTRHVTVYTVSYTALLSVRKHSLSLSYQTKEPQPINQNQKKSKPVNFTSDLDLRALIRDLSEDPSIRTVQIAIMVHSST